MAGTPVESEAKHRVADVQLLHQLLTDQGFVPSPGRLQRDEYFDTSSLVLRSNDFVVRIRKESDVLWVSLKGPRLYSGMEYLRIELEIEAASETSIRDYLASRGMTMTWYFEKRRIEYGHASSPLIVAIDEIPDVGHFVELEGPLEAVRSLAAFLNEALSHQESRNYQEIYLANQQEQGMNASDVRGAEFAARL